jgi:hypothetical protein
LPRTAVHFLADATKITIAHTMMITDADVSSQP